MALPEILHESSIDAAADLLRRYYQETFKGGQPRAGSRYDGWAGGGDEPEVVDTFTPDDCVAVSFLSVDVPARAAIAVLDTQKEEANSLLSKIDPNLDLADVKAEDFDEHLGAESPASQLWDLLRGTHTYRWGVGQTTASKMIARKRPRLIPIFDSLVGRLMGISGSGEQWEVWHAALTSDNGVLAARLKKIRNESGITQDISLLRVMDVALWMYAKDQEKAETG